jgi:hypothetical protein
MQRTHPEEHGVPVASATGAGASATSTQTRTSTRRQRAHRGPRSSVLGAVRRPGADDRACSTARRGPISWTC